MAQPKVTLQYLNPRIKGEYPQLEVAIAKLATNGVVVMMLQNNKGRIDISLDETRPGGLERAVRECNELFVPLKGVHGYNAEGLMITNGVLGQLGYELGKNQFLDGLFGLFKSWHNARYLPVVSIPKRILEIVNSA